MNVERELGQYPLSIGTSLALEGLFGVHPDQTPHPPSSKRINALWVNLRTLIRNYWASMTAEDALKVRSSQAARDILQEIQQIEVILEQQKPGWSLTLYLNDLDEARWMFPNSKFREPTTEKQNLRHMQEVNTLNNLLKMDWGLDTPITRVKKEPPATPSNVALLTNYPHELLWRFRFDLLFLLESHTGKLKGPSVWSTKLTTVSKDDHIPFNRLTLQVFGDGTLLVGQSRKVRDAVKEIAVTRKWNETTSYEKTRDDLVRNTTGEVNEVIKTLMRRG